MSRTALDYSLLSALRGLGARWRHIPLLRNPLDILTALLVMALVTRMLIVCLSYPIAGYANNYDFLRQSSCVGLWEDYGKKEKTSSNPDRPVDTLINDADIRPGLCMQSSDNIFPWLVGALADKGAHVELRAVGIAKLLATLAVVILVLAQPISSALRLALAAAATLIFGDFAITLYLNTLYLDMSLFISMFASIALTIVAYCRTRAPRWGFAALFLISLAWFAFARQQYSPFEVVVGLVAVLALVLRWRAWRLAGFLGAGAILIQASYLMTMANMSEHTRQVDKANRVDTFLSAALPAAKNWPAAVATVGLPAHCVAALGKDWYSPGFQADNPCPEVYQLSRLALLPLFLRDPGTFEKPMVMAIRISRPALLSYVGHFERASDAAGLRYRVLAATSISEFVALIPRGAYLWLVLFMCLCGPTAFFAWLYRAVRPGLHSDRDLDGVLLLVGFGGTLSIYALFSSVFGDGYGDMPRHAIGMFFNVVFLIAGMVLLLAKAWAALVEAKRVAP